MPVAGIGLTMGPNLVPALCDAAFLGDEQAMTAWLDGCGCVDARSAERNREVPRNCTSFEFARATNAVE